MNLSISKRKDGRVYLSIAQSYRKDGKTSTRTVQSLGYVDELEKQYLDPIAHFKGVVDEMNKKRKEDCAPITLSFTPEQKIDMRVIDNQLELGYSILSRYYHLLGIDRFFANRRMRGDFKYNPNSIFKLLVYERVLRPGSKSAAFSNKDRYLDRMDFSYDDLLRSLDFFAGYKKDLISWINERIAKMRDRDTSAAYYDITNYYFEVDTENDLRRRGVSKEKRKDPIVQMGLLMDKDGIPITYQLYPGNTNDCSTLLPVLKDARERYHLGRTIVVADKGLNTSNNIAALILDGHGYVFSQSVRGADAELKTWVLDDTGYKGSETFKVKSCQANKTTYIQGPDGKTVKVDVPVKRVAYWSADYAARARHERETVLSKSLKLISNSASYEHAKGYGAARYVKETVVEVSTGEVKKTVIEMDEAQIAEDERFDGYYCIITSETKMTDQMIIDTYGGLWRIEETFRVTKSELETRPVHVWTRAHIEAHFLTCYVALVLLRLIQAATSFEHSAAKVIEAIRGIVGARMKENYYLFSYRTELTDLLGALIGQNLARQVYSKDDLRKILAETKRV